MTMKVLFFLNTSKQMASEEIRSTDLRIRYFPLQF
jgi:hypothetical protein